MARDKDYVIELGGTVYELFAEGHTDPSAREIAEAHFPGKALGGEVIESVRKKLSQIRDFLEANYSEFPICLVSETYYVRFRDTPPTTAADAMRCLPVGYGKRKEGIRMQSGEDDLIWQEAVRLGLAQGAGKMKASADRAVGAYETHKLRGDDAARLLTEGRDRAQPRHPEIAEGLLEALPASTGSDEDE